MAVGVRVAEEVGGSVGLGVPEGVRDREGVGLRVPDADSVRVPEADRDGVGVGLGV